MTRPGKLLATLGLLKTEGAEDGGRARAILISQLVLFLRAGGGFSWDEWCGLSEAEKEAAAEAGDEVARSRMSGGSAILDREMVLELDLESRTRKFLEEK